MHGELFDQGRGSMYIKKENSMTGGATYLSCRTIIDEENKKKQHVEKQLDRGSTWAPCLPLMSKGERVLEGKEYFHQ